MFDLEIGRIVDWIRDRGFSSVALQLPEGLKMRGAELSRDISHGTGADVLILGYPCYGACDLFVDYKRYADALVHFGHSSIPMMGEDRDVLFVEAHTSIDIAPAVNAILDRLPRKVGLLATVQYVDMLPEVEKAIRASGRETATGTGDRRIFYPGQILGCNCSSALSIQDTVDGFLFIGEGDFHPLAAAFGVKKPLLVLNPVTGEIRDIDGIRDRILRKRFAAIEGARDAKDIAVIVCGKAGQNRMPLAKDICMKIRSAGRSAYLVVMDEITPSALLPFKADAYVCTGCPRVAMDESSRYPRPVLTATEIDIALGLNTWDNYIFDVI